MQEYYENTNNENKRIHNLLVEFVKSAGGTINTYNLWNKNFFVLRLIHFIRAAGKELTQ